MVPQRSVADFVFGVMFASVSDAAFVVRRSDRRVMSVNARLEDLIGRVAGDVVDGSAAGLFAEDARRTDDILDRPGRYEDVALRQLDGFPLDVELTIAHVEHPEWGSLAACLARDTAERRSLERDLMAKHSALYAAHAELERVVAELRRAQLSLEERNQEISLLAGQVARVGWRAAVGELAAGIAHHLNNPVGALTSTLRTLSTRLADPDPSGRADLVQLVQRARTAAGRIEEHVGAVVRLHRTGGLDATPRWLDLSHELDTALTLFSGRLDAISVRRTYSGPLAAHVPQNGLHHVLGNVIENAVTAMPTGGELNIVVDRRGETWVIAVEDTGRGVPAELEATVLDPIAAGRAGGLGLATAQRLARLWGGDLVNRPCKHGARFEIEVPAAESAAHPNRKELR